ncbi:MAG: DUF2934 domain-containing protein [Methylotenera sp.]
MASLKTTKVSRKKPIFKVESTPESNNEDNLTRIAVTAYYKAEARGYEPGHELQDWLEAEAEFSSK